MPKTSVIILNFNQPTLTVNCVNSVLRQNYKDFEIILIDNASSDDSFEIFTKELANEKVTLLRCDRNIGYAGGNNAGVKIAKGEYIAILNNDTVVKENWLETLVNALESGENIGAVSSVEIREGKQLIDYTTTKVAPSLLMYHTEEKCEKDNSKLREVFGVKGVAFIYKKNLANPPFDDEYFIYSEDTYLGWLLRLKGYKNLMSTEFLVEHFHNTVRKNSDRKTNAYFDYLGERNHLMNFFLFYETKTLVKIIPLLFLRTLVVNLSQPMEILPRTRAYIWLLTNYKKILEKRKFIQNQRKIPDSEILKHLNTKFHEESRIANPLHRNFVVLMNWIFRKYSHFTFYTLNSYISM